MQVKTERVAIDVDDNKLVGTTYLPTHDEYHSCVVLLHGGPGGKKEGPSNLFVLLGQRLANQGFTVASFDFLGSGESNGDYVDQTPSSHVYQYRRIIDWLNSRDCQHLGVVGESFGDTCALDGYDERVEALVLLWPAIWLLDEAFGPYVTPSQLEHLQKHGWIEIEDQRVGKAFVDELFADNNRESQLHNVTSPTLLIHGDNDKEVPVHQSEKAFEILSEPKRLTVVPGGEHCLRNSHEQTVVLDETVVWFSNHLERKSKETDHATD